MAIAAGRKIRATDLILPDPVGGFGNGTNVVTATAFTDLPTTACSVNITNPHATASMIVMVQYACWVNTTTTPMRVCPRASGALTAAAGIGANGPTGWGQVIRAISEQGNVVGSYFATLPPGLTTFTMQAYRENTTAATSCNYPTIDVIPLRYQF